MAQFDVYTLPNTLGMLFVDLQSGAADEFNTRLVAPLVPLDPGLKPLRKVNRELAFDARTYLFMPQLMSAVRTRDLGKPLGNIEDHVTGSSGHSTFCSSAFEGGRTPHRHPFRLEQG